MTEMSVERCDSICAYVLPYHSISLHTHFGKSGKCRLEQTATTSSILCRRHGPIWPKLEQHGVSSPKCRDMLVTFPAKPDIPSLGNCFLCVSNNLGKYVLYSSALRLRASWRTSLALLFGGQCMLPFLMADKTVDADERRSKTRMQRFVYAQQDTEDGPLKIIPPKDSMWYKFYVRNFYINQDAKLAKAFHKLP
jgi:hypothetical protein